MKLQMAQHHLNQGNPAAAEKIFKEILHDEPDNREVTMNLAQLYLSARRHDLALPLADKAISLDNGDLSGYQLLVDLLYDTNRLDAVKGVLAKAEEGIMNAGSANNWVRLSQIYNSKGLPADAERCLKKALSLDEDFYDTHLKLGLHYRDAGYIDKASHHFTQAIRLKHDCAEAHFSMSHMNKNKADSSAISAMKELYENNSLIGYDKIWIAYGLGKAYEDTGRYEDAFNCYYSANQAELQLRTLSRKKALQPFEDIKKTFSTDYFANSPANSGNASNCPVFIVGMPRSGTSLVEQILSSHSEVYGAGELIEINKIMEHVFTITRQQFPSGLDKVTSSQWAKLAEQYLSKIKLLSNGAPRVTDKMPDNFFYVGLIRLLFPNAKIVHCSRNPVDTCLSIYRNTFKGVYHYSYDLTTLGDFYRKYEDLMRHWHEVFPYAIYDVVYEDLVNNTEEEVRALLNYCNLTFEESCLEPHKTQRIVSTASAAQVRQPISSGSVENWKRFEKQLQPLIDSLGYQS